MELWRETRTGKLLNIILSDIHCHIFITHVLSNLKHELPENKHNCLLTNTPVTLIISDRLMKMGLPYENFAPAQGYLKMSVGYVNFRNLSQSPPIHDPSHLPVYPCGSRPATTSR